MRLPLPVSTRYNPLTFTLSALTLLLGISSTGALAQDKDEQQASRWGVGLAAISSQKPFKDIDRETLVVPLVFFENQYVQAFGPFINFKLPSIEISDSQQLHFRIPLKYGLGGYDEDEAEDTPILNGMDEREVGFWTGAKMEWQNPVVKISAEWLADISGNSEGQEFNLGLERSWMFGRQIMITPRLVANWQDDKFIDYYYGVRSHEVRADRPAYVAEATVNLEYGIRSAYLFNKKSSVFIDLAATQLGSEIKNSPLVDSSSDNRILMGYRYQF